MTEQKIPADIKAMKFEDALGELEKIVRSLEAGDTKLDDAISAYERGALLKAHCEAKLAEAKARVDKISLTAGGEATSEPADLD
jgi:exodeoxyribonuclease VII small subunit